MHASLRNINIGPFLSSFSLHIILFTRFACNNIIMKRTEVGKGVNNRIMLWPHSSFLSFVRHNVRPNKNTHYGRIKARTLLYNAGEQSTSRILFSFHITTK